MKNKLIDLYMQSSKHSNYQVLASNFDNIINKNDYVVNSRNEQARWDYITDKYDINEKRILDIGGNTGFFTFEAINKGAHSVDYYEGNTLHAQFVHESAKYLGLTDRINVFSEYYIFNAPRKSYDVVFLLNVIHHFGDDYGKADDINRAKDEMIKCINSFSASTNTLILQMGFNWCGNTDKNLFSNGTKEEMIGFIKKRTESFWSVVNIGVACKENNQIIFKDLDADNIQRNDFLGEFLNRPIFILQSKKTNPESVSSFV